MLEQNLRAEKADVDTFDVASRQLDRHERPVDIANLPSNISFPGNLVRLRQIPDCHRARLVGNEIVPIGADAYGGTCIDDKC